MPIGGPTIALWDLPAAPTWAGVILVAVVILYRLVIDRFAFRSLQQQVSDLETQLVAVNDKVAELEERYDEQRGLKHKALNDVAKTVMALDLVQRLAQECTCHVLDPLTEIIARLVSELSTISRRADRLEDL